MMKLLVALCCGACCAYADSAASVSLDQGYRQMYDLQFEQAHQTFTEWERAHPSDPLGPASDAAAYLFGEFDRLHILQSEFFAVDKNFLRMGKLAPDPKVKQEFEDDLDHARTLANSQNSPQNADALLAEVLVHGLNSDYLALIGKNYLDSLNETKHAREIAERLLAAHPDCYDAYLAIGVENYLLGLKPAPLRWLLHLDGAETDKLAGIAKLRIAAEKGRFLLPFARLLLAVASLRAKDRSGASEQLKWLSAHFPDNRLFREELAKAQKGS